MSVNSKTKSFLILKGIDLLFIFPHHSHKSPRLVSAGANLSDLCSLRLLFQTSNIKPDLCIGVTGNVPSRLVVWSDCIYLWKSFLLLVLFCCYHSLSSSRRNYSLTDNHTSSSDLHQDHAGSFLFHYLHAA